MRRHHDAPAPLRVKFGLIDDQLGTYDFGPRSPWMFKAYACGVTKEYSDTMIANVLRPAIEMMGAVEEPVTHAPFRREEIGRYADYDYHIGALVDAARAGAEVPKFAPPQWASDEAGRFLGDGRRPVVITLRETAAQSERNSRVTEWMTFARSLMPEHRVIFVRDTCKANERLIEDAEWPFEFVTYPRASRNAYVRAALYQRALVNMFVGNGPIGWALFSDAPYLAFKQLVPEMKNWDAGTPKGWKEQAHLEVGEQWPWASSRQRMTWKDDTFENIRDEFNNFMRNA